MKPATSTQSSPAGRAAVGRWRAVVVAIGLTLLPAPCASGADVVVAKEYQLKAAFICNFTKFVTWPLSNSSDTNSPIVLGVVGKGSLWSELTRAVKDYNVNGRQLTVQLVDTPEDARAVQLLFIPADKDEQLAEFLNELLEENVLTVGESDRFSKCGGVINFLIEGDSIRFDINMRAAERAGLKVSAQLQKLAKTVRKSP